MGRILAATPLDFVNFFFDFERLEIVKFGLM